MMKTALTSWVMAAISAFLFACAGRPAPDVAAAPDAAAAPDQTRYTAHSFFYDKGKHLTTNYRTGTLVPINTKVRIVSSGSKNIKIELAEGGQAIEIENVANYSGQDTSGILGRMFSPAPIDLSRFSDQDRSLILTGQVGVGMSKEAVLLALGYPPSHKTPSLESDAWTYWRNRFVTFVVEFENGKVARVR
jgi:hypothetical protein